MAEYLDDLLTCHHFFNKALHLAERMLLTDEVTGGAAANMLCDKRHADDAGDDDQRQPDAVIDHDGKDGDYDNARADKLREAL